MAKAVSVNGWPAFTSWAVNKSLGYFQIKDKSGKTWTLYTLKSLIPFWTNVLLDIDALVMPLSRLVESFDPRYINGTGLWSNHSSGSAIDDCTAKLPQHRYRMTAAQRVQCAKILAWYSPVLEWGGNWKPAYLDEMHWQIRQSPAGDGTRIISQAMVDAVVRKGRLVKPPKPPTPHPPIPPSIPGEEGMQLIKGVKKQGFNASAVWLVSTEIKSSDDGTLYPYTILLWVTNTSTLNGYLASGIKYGTCSQSWLDSMPITGPTPPVG